MPATFDSLWDIFNTCKAAVGDTATKVVNYQGLDVPLKSGIIQLTPKMMTTIAPQMKAVNAANYASAVNKFRSKYQDMTEPTMPMFVAMTLEESGLFSTLEENLYYSTPERLRAVWPNRFSNLDYARGYIKNPAKLANLVYANRMGNGAEASGDGWANRGRGAIQITGYDNYNRLAKRLNMTIDKTHDYCLTPDGAVESAMVYWVDNKLTRFTQKEDVPAATKAINGGYTNLEARQKLFDAADKVL